MKANKPRGRPLKAHEPGTSPVMSIKMPAELKNRLQAEATSSGRSFSQEVQGRLERSLDASGKQWESRYGPLAAGYAHRVALSLYVLEEAPDHEPFEKAARDAAAAVVLAIDILTGKAKP